MTNNDKFEQSPDLLTRLTNAAVPAEKAPAGCHVILVTDAIQIVAALQEAEALRANHAEAVGGGEADEFGLSKASKWGPFRHNNGVICCGSLRVARADFDTDPSPEVQAEILDALCSTAQPSPSASQPSAVDVDLMRKALQAFIADWEHPEGDSAIGESVYLLAKAALAIQQAPASQPADAQNSERERWAWMMDWCRQKRMNPADATAWENAERAYVATLTAAAPLDAKAFDKALGRVVKATMIDGVGEVLDAVDALRSLVFAAETSGGTAGRDEYLCAAIEQAKRTLAAADGMVKVPRDDVEAAIAIMHAYKLGFLRCSEWAERDDLPSDVHSAAFNKDAMADLKGLLDKFESRGPALSPARPDAPCDEAERSLILAALNIYRAGRSDGAGSTFDIFAAGWRARGLI